MHYYQHHIGDFIKATATLPAHMMGGYLRLIWMYYDSEEPLPDAPEVLALKTGIEAGEVELLLRAYFYKEEGVWRHRRCDREIDEYRAMAEKNRSNGKAGGRPSKKTQKKPTGFPVGTQSEPTGNPEATHTEPCGNPVVTLTSNQEPLTKEEVPSGTSLAAKRRTRIPADFVPNETGKRVAVERGVDLQSELQQFHNYHSAKGNVMADWQAAWRTWVGNARPPRHSTPSHPVLSPVGVQTAANAQAAKELIFGSNP